MKKYFIAGLLFWVPVVVTIFILRFFVEAIEGINGFIPPNLRPEVLFGFNIPWFGFVLAVIIIFVTGILVANFFGKKVVLLWESFLAKIPLVRSIYKSVKQSMQVIFSSSGNAFREVALVEYPRKGLYSLGFITNITGEDANKVYSIFIPTTPNPTSGFLLMMQEHEFQVLDLPVDIALKAVISLGTIKPCDYEQYIVQT